MKRLRYLFVDKNWKLDFAGPDITKAHVECYGNFFEMMFAVFQIMTHKDNF